MSDCSMVPFVSTTTTLDGESPIVSIAEDPPTRRYMISSKNRMRVSWTGAWYHLSKTAISQSAYGVGEQLPTRPGGGDIHVACGNNRSIAGGSKPRSASYVDT